MTDVPRIMLTAVLIVPRGGFAGFANTSPAPSFAGSEGEVEGALSSAFPFFSF